MRKVAFLVVSFLLWGVMATRMVSASGFNVKSIGSINADGQQISHWWYTNSNPTLTGEAPAGSEVTVSIDGSSSSVTANDSNGWTYAASGLAEGDHSVSIDNNGSNISFTLTIGVENVDWDAVNSGTSETLPTVGIVFPTILLSSAGAGMVLLAKKLAKRD